mmetsp:Transcript_55037/g.133697  ORF Transcript_55037/g.133697 Transcript_55037/m.133697 type:complete len:107 (-) Transcript_55037:23-343(-)
MISNDFPGAPVGAGAGDGASDAGVAVSDAGSGLGASSDDGAGAGAGAGATSPSPDFSPPSSVDIFFKLINKYSYPTIRRLKNIFLCQDNVTTVQSTTPWFGLATRW